MSWVKCSKCGAINTEFSEKCHYCEKTLNTGDGIIYSDNTSSTLEELKNYMLMINGVI